MYCLTFITAFVSISEVTKFGLQDVEFFNYDPLISTAKAKPFNDRFWTFLGFPLSQGNGDFVQSFAVEFGFTPNCFRP